MIGINVGWYCWVEYVQEVFDDWAANCNFGFDIHVKSKCLETKRAANSFADSLLSSLILWSSPLVKGEVELELLNVESESLLGGFKRVDVLEAVHWELWDFNSGVEGDSTSDEVHAKSPDELVVSFSFWAVIADLLPVLNHSFLVSLKLIKVGGIDLGEVVELLVGAFSCELLVKEFVESNEGKALVNDVGGFTESSRV